MKYRFTTNKHNRCFAKARQAELKRPIGLEPCRDQRRLRQAQNLPASSNQGEK